jgi:hypothetical protein
MEQVMKPSTISPHPGFVTKGQKGKLLWHPKMPEFDMKQNDWDATKSIEVTNCIHDPWPFVAGGKDCMMEISGPTMK